MNIATSLGYVSIVRGLRGDWEIRRGPRRLASPSVADGLRDVGVPNNEARRIASMMRHPSGKLRGTLGRAV
jgi:hypothetical protein